MAIAESKILNMLIYIVVILVVAWVIIGFIGPKLFGFLNSVENLKIEYILPFFRNIYILKSRG